MSTYFLISNKVSLFRITDSISDLLCLGYVSYFFLELQVLPLENKLKNASHFPRIINVGFAIVIVLYFNMAIFGYMTFQDECRGSITLNLPNLK